MQNRNQSYPDELAGLQQALQERQAAFDDLEKRLSSAINDLRAQLNEKQTLIDHSELNSQQAKADITEILEQKTRLELIQKQTERFLSAQAEQIRAGVRTEIEALERQLSDKEAALQRCHGCAKEAELNHSAELLELQHRLTEMQLLSETRNLQIADLRAETARLSRKIAQQKSVESEGGGSRVNTDIAKPETTPRHNTQHELQALRQDAEEKHLLLASRNEELMRVKAEMDVLQDRVSELECSAKRIEESAESECAKMRTEFQAQLAFLQAELSQKEWALEEGQGAQKALEQALRAKIDELESQLAQRKALLEHSAQDFVLGDSWEAEPGLDGTWKLQERLDSDSSESVQPAAANQHARKWRNSGQWKSRWRSR